MKKTDMLTAIFLDSCAILDKREYLLCTKTKNSNVSYQNNK